LGGADALMPAPDTYAKREFRCGVALRGAGLARDLGPCGWVPAVAVWNGTLAAAVTVLTPRTLHRASPLPGCGRDVADPRARFHPLSADATSLRAVAVRDGVASAPSILDARLARQPAQLGDSFGLAALPGGAYATWVGAPQAARSVVGARLALR
jgi:hypothetical protein